MVRVNDIPEAGLSYDLTNKKVMIHDLDAEFNASTSLIDVSRLIAETFNDGNYGDITLSNSSTEWRINNNAVTLSKLATINANTLLGNSTGSTANVQTITLGSTLTFTGSTLGVVNDTSIQKTNVLLEGVFVGSRVNLNFLAGTGIDLDVVNNSGSNRVDITISSTPSMVIEDGTYGDIVVTGTGATWTVGTSAITTSKVYNNAITYSKFQQVSSVSILGNPTGSLANVSEITLGSTLAFTGSVLGVTNDSSIQKVSILSGGTLIGSRRNINFSFANLSYNISDDAGNNRVNISLTGLAPLIAGYEGGTYIGLRGGFNFIAGDDIDINVVDNPGNNRIDITIASTADASVPALEDVIAVGATSTNTLFVKSNSSYIGVRNTAETSGVSLYGNATDPSIVLLRSTGATNTIKADNTTGSKVVQLPNANGILPVSINGQTANTAGEITLSIPTNFIETIAAGNFIYIDDSDPANLEISVINVAPLNSPVLTGVPEAPTVSLSDNSTKIATTAFVKGQNYTIFDSTLNTGAVPFANASGHLMQNTGLNFDGTDLYSGTLSDSEFSGIQLNGGKAYLLACLDGIQIGLGAQSGSADTAKTLKIFNKGQLYVDFSSTSTTNHIASFETHLYPETHETWDLGHSSLSWSNLYVQNIITTGTITGPSMDAKADLVGGLVPLTQLPGFVPDILLGHYINSTLFEDEDNDPYIPEANKLYIDITTNEPYRWTGLAYVELPSSLVLGELPDNAYRGDRGKIAYDHSQITSGNPHGVTKTHVGLSNVDNTSDLNKPISTATQTALDLKENKLITFNTQTIDYTLVLADANKVVEINKATSGSITIPPNVFPVNTKIEFATYGAGQITVIPGAGVTMRSANGANKLAVQYSWGAIVQRATNEWYFLGDIST